jgi:hypothetical protein
MAPLEITLQYTGRNSEQGEIDLYDVSQALIGFQRSLALTTHLILNNEIITQAPSLKGARIYALPPRAGSWELTAAVAVTAAAAGALYKLGTAPKDTPIGHLIRSAYDYVISETLGFHVDYDKTLGQQYEDIKSQDSTTETLSQARFDSLVEKCEVAIREMHRPISKSRTALKGRLIAIEGTDEALIGPPLTNETYEYIAHTERSSGIEQIDGRVSSYNINTFKGRIYAFREGRPIPFELLETARDDQSIAAITASLSANAQSRSDGEGEIRFLAYEGRSRSGRLKQYHVMEVLSPSHPDW